MRRRAAFGAAIPAVVLFIGLMASLIIPSHFFVLTEALDRLGLLGGRVRPPGLPPPGRFAAPPQPLWIEGGMLWDAAGGLRPNPGIGTEAGRLTASRPAGARALDAAGCTILPGLIDAHVHSLGGSFDGEALIARGVTTARDLGSDLRGVLAHRARAAQGSRLGPRVSVAGPYLVGGEASGDQQRAVASAQEAASAVAELALAGADGVKTHQGIGADLLAAVVEAARPRGLWVAAHLDDVPAAAAALLGVDTLEHASGWDWDGPAGDDLAAQDELIALLAARRVAVTPTLAVAERSASPAAAAADPELAYLPWLVRRGWIHRIAGIPPAEPGAPAGRGKRLERIGRFAARLSAAGGIVLAGSDAPAWLVPHGAGLQREIELLRRAGIPPARVLAAATHDAARALRLERETGLLLPGMRADLLLVRGDPLAEPAALRRVAMVVRDGRVALDALN
ncbi:MAG TPA: amidohydrolase family protein [Candidatus Polarisedimenticolia bacterium]|nr:amidohydrolase family protein [Candidatus Polarisedimenticolia bacterium]